jgi:hypothetical protein
LGDGYPEPSRIGVMPAYGIFARHVSNLELANVHVSFEREDLRPAMACIDVDGLEVDNFKAKLADGVPGARLREVRNIVIRDSPALKDVPAGVAKP